MPVTPAPRRFLWRHSPTKSRQGATPLRDSSMTKNLLRALQDVRCDADGNTLRRLVERVGRPMRVACLRLDIAAAEQPSDHRQGFSKL